MPITDAQKDAINGMCPAAKAVGLGTHVQAVEQGTVPEGSIGTAELADDAVTKAKVNADVAGNGLGQNADGSLEVKVDDTTLAIATDTLAVKDGGIAVAKLADNAVETAKIKDGEVTSGKLATALQALVLGAASGYKIARGAAAVTGTLDVVTGLATVVAVVACLKDDASVDALWVSAALHATAGTITLKAWKPTATDNCTPIAATAEKNINWIAIGT